MLQFGYRPQLRMPQPALGQQQMMQGDAGFDGKMLRKAMARKTVDYNTSAVKYLEDRIWKRDYRDERALQADPLYTQQLTLPQDMLDNPANCVTTKFIRAALNKDPRPVFCVCWTPDGRRLITGASSGEFTLWNGLTFNFETILQAHNCAVRAMIWSRSEQWMLTGDDKGYIKYWQANMNNVKMFQGHIEAIRGLSFAPTDCKFTSCSDDRTVRIFDFVTCTEETVLNGHGSDVKCVDWHPFKSLIVSGSKDSQQPIILWDPRMSGAKKITTLHAHKNTCTDLKWNQFNGNWLVSSSRDHLCKLFDIRNLKEEVQSFRGHKKDACTVAWHPIYEKLFASGGADGSIFFWQTGAEKELGSMEDAHEGMVWDLSWHPLGHMLVSGSNDRSTRFWTRNRPGDTIVDKTDEISMPKAERVTGIIFKNIEIHEMDQQKEGLVCLPGLGLEKDMIDSVGDNDESPDNMSPQVKNTQQPRQFNPQQHHHHQQQQQHHQLMLQQQNQIHQQQAAQLLQQFKKENQIPSIDLDDDPSKKKAPYSKPIPKEFEKAWKSNKPMNQAPPPLIPVGGMMMPSLSMPPPISGVPNLMNVNQLPPSLLSADIKPTINKSTSQPIRLMDLMATTLEPVVSKQSNFKRKLSQENNNMSPSKQGDQDTDDRQWQPNNKNRQFFNQNKNKNFNNNNYDDNSNNQDENYDENENGNNFNEFNNNSNNNFNQNRRNATGNNARRGQNNQNNSFNNKKFNDNNQDEENWPSDSNNDNDGYNDGFNEDFNETNNNFNNNRNRGSTGNNNTRNRNNNNNSNNNRAGNGSNNKNWSYNNNNNNTSESESNNDVNNTSGDAYDPNFESNRLKNNRRGGFSNQRRGYNNNYNNNNSNNTVSDNNS